MTIKKRHYILTAIVSYLLILIATIPARPVTNLLSENSPLTIQGASGTLWNGKAYFIAMNNIQLKETQWSLSILKLFIGKLSIDMNTLFSGNKITAELGTSFLGRYFVNNLSTKISAAEVAKLIEIPLAQLDGMISLDIEHAQWKQGELPQATGEMIWQNATITVADTASLGNISILLGESKQQLLKAEIKNQGGDIKISGSAELIPEADYSANILLTPTATAKANIKQSLSLFAKKQPNGGYLLKKTGSLSDIM